MTEGAADVETGLAVGSDGAVIVADVNTIPLSTLYIYMADRMLVLDATQLPLILCEEPIQ